MNIRDITESVHVFTDQNEWLANLKKIYPHYVTSGERTGEDILAYSRTYNDYQKRYEDQAQVGFWDKGASRGELWTELDLLHRLIKF